MKERPILFSTPMVQAILDGRKTVTRRVIKDEWAIDTLNLIAVEGPVNLIYSEWAEEDPEDGDGIHKPEWLVHDKDRDWVYPMGQGYGKEEDILWVRETWGELYDTCDHPELPDNPQERWSLGYVYKADDYKHTTDTDGFFTGWKPSIHMPKEACRLKLEIVSIRVERLHDITQEDAKREGVEWVQSGWKDYTKPGVWFDAKSSFISLWTSINGQESWDSNPWVWVINFRKL